MTQTRQEIGEKIVMARTQEEVAEARELRDQWLSEHPSDIGILEASETLELMADALGMERNEIRVGRLAAV